MAHDLFPVRVLYVSHNSIDTALVRSQVLPYLRGLAIDGHDVGLVTFERGKPAGVHDLARDAGWAPIAWTWVPASPGSHLLAKVIDALRGVGMILWLVLRRRINVLHARSYLPAAMSWVAGKLTRRPYVFDMRGFLGQEYVDARYWGAGDFRYRLVQWAEKRLLRDAAEIIVLTDAAADRLRNDPQYERWVDRRPVTVIPCAVDLSRFRPLPRRALQPTLVYSGSLGMWYLLDEMLRVYTFAREHVPGLRILILNRHEQALITSAIERLGIDPSHVEIRVADFSEMPKVLGAAHVAIALLRQVPSKIGSSPIKIAEYLACGLPTVVNAHLGDSDALIRRYGAGHVVDNFTEVNLRRAGAAVAGLIDNELARRGARRLAEDVYSLDAAVRRYGQVYARLGRRAAIRGS